MLKIMIGSTRLSIRPVCCHSSSVSDDSICIKDCLCGGWGDGSGWKELDWVWMVGRERQWGVDGSGGRVCCLLSSKLPRQFRTANLVSLLVSLFILFKIGTMHIAKLYDLSRSVSGKPCFALGQALLILIDDIPLSWSMVSFGPFSPPSCRLWG